MMLATRFAAVANFLNLVLKFVKEAKNLFVVYNGEKLNKSGTFWRVSVFGTLTISVINLYMEYSPAAIRYEINSQNEKVYSSMDKILKSCGRDSFMFWSVIKGSNLRIEAARGCVNNENNCIDNNVKEHNPRYKDRFILDPNTYSEMQNTPDKGIIATEHIGEWEKFATLHELFVEIPNLEIEKAGIVLVKDFKNDIVYAFTLSFVKGAKIKCYKPFQRLQDFGMEIGEYL